MSPPTVSAMGRRTSPLSCSADAMEVLTNACILATLLLLALVSDTPPDCALRPTSRRTKSA